MFLNFMTTYSQSLLKKYINHYFFFGLEKIAVQKISIKSKILIYLVKKTKVCTKAVVI